MLETLRIFRDIVETHSFSRAAASNFVTQSAVSQRIRKLEDELGQRLVIRNRNIELTEAGRILYAASKDILTRYERSLSELRGLQTVVAGKVRLGTVPSIGLHRLPPCIKLFLRRYPAAVLDVEYRTFPEIYAGLLDGTLDVGVVACPLRHPQTVVVPLCIDEMVVILPPAHPLARSRRIDAAKLRGEVFVAFDDAAPTRRMVERYLQRAYVEVRVVRQLDNVETIKRAVEAGTGISIVPRSAVAQEVRDGTLAAVSLADPGLERPIALIHRKGRPLEAAAERLIEVLREEI